MDRKPVLAGDLGFVPMSDLFQILGESNSTGVLLITAEFSPARGEIYFASGEPVDASWGSLNGIEAVYALLGWLEGRFEFRPQEFSGRRKIRKGRMEILLDAMRMIDDGLIRKMGAPGQASRNRHLHEKRQEGELPTVTGSLIDYSYIVSEERFRSGRRIVSEGSHGNWIWVILEGKALLSRGAGGTERPLCCLGEGAFIGSLGILRFGDHVRTSTVTAQTRVHSALLDTARLSSELMSVSPEFRTYLLRLSARVEEVTDDLMGFLVGKGERRLRAPAGWHHGRSETPGRESLELERFQEEYVRLSRTFKGFIQWTVNTISVLTTRRSKIQKSISQDRSSMP